MTLTELLAESLAAAKAARDAGKVDWEIEAARQKVFDEYRTANGIGYSHQWQPSVLTATTEEPREPVNCGRTYERKGERF